MTPRLQPTDLLEEIRALKTVEGHPKDASAGGDFLIVAGPVDYCTACAMAIMPRKPYGHLMPYRKDGLLYCSTVCRDWVWAKGARSRGLAAGAAQPDMSRATEVGVMTMTDKPKYARTLDRRLYAEAAAEVFEDKAAVPENDEDLDEKIIRAWQVKMWQLAKEQVDRWLKHYDIAAKDPSYRYQLLLRELALDHLEVENAKKPIGATKWTYAKSLELVSAVDECCKANGGNFKKAFAAVRRLDRYKTLDDLRPRYYEAKKRVRECVIPVIMGHDPDDYLKSEELFRRAERKIKSTK